MFFDLHSAQSGLLNTESLVHQKTDGYLSNFKIALVRHGRASAGWDTALDPAIDELGLSQATEAAAKLSKIFGDGQVQIVSSPLLRCQQTAEAFTKLRGSQAQIAEQVSEIPSPPGVQMKDRVDWLRVVMQGNWSDLDLNFISFRDELLKFVRAIDQNTVIFSHFIAINAVVGSIINDDRLVIHKLDNGSITILEGETNGALRIAQGGHEADTLIR